jgi:hypothetical protein
MNGRSAAPSLPYAAIDIHLNDLSANMSITKKSALAAILSALLIEGCTPLRDPSHLNFSNVSDKQAIVVFTTGSPALCSLSSPDPWMVSIFPVGAPYPKGYVLVATISNTFMKSDFTDHPGSILAVALDPGDYYVAPIVFNGQATQVARYDFSVSAGEVVYLGEYWMLKGCEPPTSTDGSGKIALHAIATFRDQEQRDFALLAEKNPQLSKANITKQILVESGTVSTPTKQ